MTVRIELTDAERHALADLSQRTGKSPDALLHEAVSHFLVSNSEADHLPLLRKARGIWRDRNDLPDFAHLRREWDRS